MVVWIVPEAGCIDPSAGGWTGTNRTDPKGTGFPLYVTFPCTRACS